MQIGIPTETKSHEYRVGATPAGVHSLVTAGHSVVVQAGAGLGSGYTDDEFRAAGAAIAPSGADAWAQEFVLKVKEPTPEEYQYFRPDMTLFTYLHLAADRRLTEEVLASGMVAIAYETVQMADGSLPLLTPMSEVAGRLAPLEGASHLRSPAGGRGILMSGVPGTRKAAVAIIGGGVAGESAATMALGMGADVTVLDVSLNRLRQLDSRFGGAVRTLASNEYELTRVVAEADMVIGSVLIPGAAAPKLVTDSMIEAARPGAVFVDIAIDQGGCFEGSRPTSHTDPTFRVHDTVFYCVSNMPGAVPGTSTPALTNATLPYALRVASLGWEAAIAADPSLAKGVNAARGLLLSSGVAAAHGMDVAELADANML